MLPIILGGTGLILASLYIQGPTNNVSVRSTLDNKEYKVQNLPDKQEAANLLSKIHHMKDYMQDSILKI